MCQIDAGEGIVFSATPVTEGRECALVTRSRRMDPRVVRHAQASYPPLYGEGWPADLGLRLRCVRLVNRQQGCNSAAVLYLGVAFGNIQCSTLGAAPVHFYEELDCSPRPTGLRVEDRWDVSAVVD